MTKGCLGALGSSRGEMDEEAEAGAEAEAGEEDGGDKRSPSKRRPEK